MYDQNSYGSCPDSELDERDVDDPWRVFKFAMFVCIMSAVLGGLTMAVACLLSPASSRGDHTYPTQYYHSGITGLPGTASHAPVPYVWDKEQERFLRGLAGRSGPTDTNPTLVVEQTWRKSLEGRSECSISTFDGKLVWHGSGRTPDEAMDSAIESYREYRREMRTRENPPIVHPSTASHR